MRMTNTCDAGTASVRRNYKKNSRKPEYRTSLQKSMGAIKKGHQARRESGDKYKELVSEIVTNPAVQEMKKFNHHSHTNCFEHSVHVSYYNYLICSRLGWDAKAAAKAGLLHDLFLYDWHGHKPEEGERMHGFEHPTKALKNAQNNFDITRKEGDIILKHMFPLTIAPPKYKESCVIIMTDKFCSVCEVMDRFFKREKRKSFSKEKERTGKKRK